MPLSDKSNPLSSDQHKNKTKQPHIWCEDCGKYISDKKRHFQSEFHTLRSQNNHICQDTRSTQNTFGNGVEVSVNEKTYIKLRVNPTGVASQNLEHHVNELLDKNYFPRYKYQSSYLAKFSKIVNGEENEFHKWLESDFNYSHMQSTFGTNLNVYNTLRQKIDDEELERSGFLLNGIVNVIFETYKVNDIQASSYIELPEKYKNNKSIIKKMMINIVFYGAS